MASKRAGAEVGEPGSHYLLVAIQVTAHPCRSGCRPANLGGSKQPASSLPCSGEDDEGRAEKHGVAYRGIVARSPSPSSQNPEELPTRFRVLARRLLGWTG